MVSKFKKKPVVIEAVRWDGTNLDEVMHFCAGLARYELMARGNSELVISTLEDGDDLIAKHVASKGDWIIKGVQGEFYPCKPDIFEASYGLADEDEQELYVQVLEQKIKSSREANYNIINGLNDEIAILKTQLRAARDAHISISKEQCEEIASLNERLNSFNNIDVPLTDVDLEAKLAKSEEAKNGAYAERNKLVRILASIFPSGIKKTAIEGWDEAWHWCVYIDLPTGQASWHFHNSELGMFLDLPFYRGVWDGHTTEQKYERIEKLFYHILADGIETVLKSKL